MTTNSINSVAAGASHWHANPFRKKDDASLTLANKVQEAVNAALGKKDSCSENVAKTVGRLANRATELTGKASAKVALIAIEAGAKATEVAAEIGAKASKSAVEVGARLTQAGIDAGFVGVEEILVPGIGIGAEVTSAVLPTAIEVAADNAPAIANVGAKVLRAAVNIFGASKVGEVAAEAAATGIEKSLEGSAKAAELMLESFLRGDDETANKAAQAALASIEHSLRIGAAIAGGFIDEAIHDHSSDVEPIKSKSTKQKVKDALQELKSPKGHTKNG